MLIGFFEDLRAHKVPVTLRELLDLFGALKHHVVHNLHCSLYVTYT